MERTPRERPHWEMVSGIVAIIVGVAALGITAYTAYLQRRQALSAVWPRVVFGDSDTPVFRILVQNKGVGPAIVRDVKVRVDDRPVTSWAEAFALVVGERASEINRGAVYSSIGHAVLSAGELVEAYRLQAALLPQERGDLGRRLHASICYCSIFDECWSTSDDDAPVAVRECPTPGPESFRQ